MGRFLLTGSQQFGLMSGISQSLAGDMARSPTLIYGGEGEHQRKAVRVLGWDRVGGGLGISPLARGQAIP